MGVTMSESDSRWYSWTVYRNREPKGPTVGYYMYASRKARAFNEQPIGGEPDMPLADFAKLIRHTPQWAIFHDYMIAEGLGDHIKEN